MGTSYPFQPAETLSPYAMLAPDARAKQTPGEKIQAAILQHTLQTDQLGQWAGNRYEQTNHNTGCISIAAKAYTDVVAGSKINLLQRKPARDGILTKSTSGSGNYATDDEYEPADPDHPLARVLEEPGGPKGAWSMTQECAFLTLQYMLTGDAPAWAPVGEHNKPVRFFALTSALTTPQIRPGTDARYPHGAYRVQPYGPSGFYMGGQLGTFAILPGEEVKCFRELHPWARNQGMSRLESGAKEIDVLEAITASRWAYFDGGLQLDTVALLPGADKDVVDQFQKSMQGKAGGAKNSRRFVVIGGAAIQDANWKLQSYGQTARDLDFHEGYDQSAGIVGAFFRTPRGVLGFTSASSYAQHFAEIQQFWDLGVTPFCRGMSVFLTGALARPWSETPGELKIEVEARKPKDVEMEKDQVQFAYQNDAITVNQYLKATGYPPVEGGDVPHSIYLAKLQQQFAPPPPQALPPGVMAGMPGAEQPAEEPGAGAEEPDSPEATQDAVASAALEALGVPAEDAEQPAGVAKALPPPAKAGANPRTVRREGEVWSTGGNNYYTKRGGKIVRTAPPGDAHQRDYYGNLKPGAAQPAAQPAARPANPIPVTKPTGAPRPAPVPPPLPAPGGKVWAGGVAPWGLGTTGGPQEFGGMPVHPEAVARAAAKVNAATPAAKQTLASVGEWAAMHADRHADKVAAHFGITREKAHALLVHAITAVANHAAKTGGRGASGTLTVGGKQLRVTQPGAGTKPTAGAVPRPANPGAAGSLPPRTKAMSALDSTTGGALVAEGQPVNRIRGKKKRKPVAAVVAECIKALEG